MRRATVIALCALVLGTTVPGTAAAASGHDDAFRGHWTSVDLDGSNQTLKIQGSGKSGHHSMRLFDDAATGACGGSPAHFQGSGVVEGDTLMMTGTLTCQPGGNPLHFRITVGFVYDSATDTLTDDSGVAWDRG